MYFHFIRQIIATHFQRQRASLTIGTQLCLIIKIKLQQICNKKLNQELYKNKNQKNYTLSIFLKKFKCFKKIKIQ